MSVFVSVSYLRIAEDEAPGLIHGSCFRVPPELGDQIKRPAAELVQPGARRPVSPA